MPGEELKRALRRVGATASLDAWHQAEQAVAEQRQAIDKEQSDLRTAAERRLAADIEAVRSELLHAADARVRTLRLQTEAALAQRLKSLAREALGTIADAGRAAFWSSLMAEIPGADWRSVRVHPADRDRARNDLPQADVATDETLSGGLVVSTADGQVQVDNSLTCRLERAWPELLPGLLGELRTLMDET